MTKRKMDEYDDIYGRYEGSGFIFDYSRGRLSKSKVIYKEDVKRINPIKRNSDDTPLYVVCRLCKSHMDFISGSTDNLDGYWKCPSCGIKVRERTVYSQLDRENIEFMNIGEQDANDEPEWL